MPSLATLSLLLAQANPPADAASNGLSMGSEAAIIIVVIGASFALGAFLARRLRMPEYNFKIGLVLASLFGAIAINILLWPPKLGIDLSGGVVLVYEIDQNQMQESNRGQILDQLSHQLGSVEQQKLKPRLSADKMIEIPLPSTAAAEKVEQTVERLNAKGLGVKKVGLRSVDGKPVLAYEPIRQDKRIDMDKLIGAVSKRINPSGVKEVTVRQYGADQIEIIVPEVEEREVEQIKQIISTSGNLQFRILANLRESDHKDLIELAQQTQADEVYQGSKLKARWIEMRKGVDPRSAVLRKTKAGVEQVLVLIDDYNVNGDYLSSASQGVDERGNLCINFSFNSQGAAKFGQLTGENLPNKATGLSHELGIVLDNQLQSAASIRSTITDRGQITGSFDEAYVNFVVNVLNSGSLPAALQKEPISSDEISSQLGDDTIRSGRDAMILSTIAVVLFMLFYYRFAGLVADLAVVMNMILAVALMLLIKAAFTLPGLAGLVLTVGMAVDANVLVYERMREEAARGASLRMTIRNGFSRAMATIIDSNLTTVATAVVLFAIGTDQIKGFAVSLILGLVVSMYTAVYVAHVIFDVFERQQWLTRLHMRQMIGETHIDFVKWRVPAISASLVVIAIGAVAVWERGKEILDIDFTGGSSVQVVFKSADDPKQQVTIDDVRKKIAGLKDLEDVSVSSVGRQHLAYKIDTSERDIQKVQTQLQEAFGDSLATYSMSYKDLAPVKMSSEPAGAKSTLKLLPAGERKPPAAESDAAAPKAGASSPPAVPKSNQGSALPGADDSALAFAAGDDANLSALVLAQAVGKPAARPKAPPAAAPKTTPPAIGTAKQPAAGTTKQPPAAATQPATETVDSATGAAAGEAAAEQDATVEAAPAETPAGDAAAGEAETKSPPASEQATATEVKLHFGEEINQPTLRKSIEMELETAKLPLVPFELSNPKFVSHSAKGFQDWNLAIQLSPQDTKQLLEQMQIRLAHTPVFPSSSNIGGKVAGKTQFLALEALLASLVIIVIYVWVRFQSIMFGFAAVLALIHDVLVTVGFLALSAYLAPYFGFLLIDPFKISLAVVAALLTIVGYSINDTIVIFDRIREIRGKNPDLTDKMINDSVNQTLGRTILTSGTVLIGTLILYFIGGPGIHPFAYAMLVGLISGTYSTVYIASPVLLWLRKSEPGQGFSSAVQRSPAVR
jgi:SecD/SecF fusion protein